MSNQADALASIPVRNHVDLDIDEITKKYANRSGGGHYRRDWSDNLWCCDNCRAIYDALVEFATRYNLK